MKRQLSLATAASLVVLALVGPLNAAASSGALTPVNMCIVSLSPTATETLFAVGAGKQVEAVDTDSNYPTTGLPKKRIDPFNPSAEAIATICTVTKAHPSPKPDVVVIAFDANSIAEKLGALGIRVIIQGAPNTLSDAYGQMTTLGTATGHPGAAAYIVKSLKALIAKDIKLITAHPHKMLTTYWELDPTLYSLTSSTFVGSMMTPLGVTNIADPVSTSADGGYPQLSSEYLIASSPRLVILADTICCHVNAKNFGQRTGFSFISAVQHHHVYGINDAVASRWGPRLGILMNDITRVVQITLADPNVWK